MKKIPLRTCVISKEKLAKKDLFRVVKDKEGNISVDETGSSNGRGVYLKKDINIINKAKENHALDYHLKAKVDGNIYDELISKL